MATVLAISADLLLGSKVEAMLAAAGHEVTLSASLPPSPPPGAELIVADLDAASPTELAGLGLPVLGYYSHVDAQTREAAREAGIDLAVPRSRMARELPELAARLLAERP
ncbi:MAG TPA: hypothetical protein VG518_01025 [Solirubrobacterales bacterium]|nr:hypothetical protein [Solirubrobacterales bacterium]